jgi:hypothetical protein
MMSLVAFAILALFCEDEYMVVAMTAKVANIAMATNISMREKPRRERGNEAAAGEFLLTGRGRTCKTCREFSYFAPQMCVPRITFSQSVSGKVVKWITPSASGRLSRCRNRMSDKWIFARSRNRVRWISAVCGLLAAFSRIFA